MSQAEMIKKLHAASPLPFALLDKEFSVVWVNECAKKRYPQLLVSGGVSLLFSSEQLAQIKKTAKEKKTFSVPLAGMAQFAAAFEQVEDGFLLTIGYADFESVSTILPESTRFLTMAVSGRLRAPLSNVFASVSALARTSEAQENEHIHELLQQINLNGYHMLRFAVDFNAYLSLIMGEYEPKTDMVELTAALGAVFKAAGMLTESVGIPLKLTLPEEKMFAEADIGMLNHALLHIISNCCRFTREGNEISVAVSHGDGCAMIIVEDKGIGMSEEVASKVCEPFYSRDPEGMPMAGNGLGLAVARSIIANHKGSLAISSKEGEGTGIAIRLPLASDEATLNLKSSVAAVDMLRDRFSMLHTVLSDSCGVPEP